MKHLMIKCKMSDSQFVEETKKEFPKAEIIKEKHFGGEEWIVVAIPLIGLTFQIADFVFTHLVKPKEVGDETDRQDKRVIIMPNGEISVNGYSMEDVIKLLKEMEEENDH